MVGWGLAIPINKIFLHTEMGKKAGILKNIADTAMGGREIRLCLGIEQPLLVEDNMALIR